MYEERGCKVNIVVGYRVVIVIVYVGWRGRLVSFNIDFLSLIKGIFNSNLCVKFLLFNWDLLFVLLVLCEFLFELLVVCNLKYFIWKIVFLFVMVIVVRVSEF